MISTNTNADLFKKITCRYCNAPLRDSFLNLGAVPLANSFLKPEQKNEEEFICPLALTWCPECTLVQLTHAVPPELMFSNYLYVSSTTDTFKRHFSEYARSVKKWLGKRENVLAVDIGSNDGLLLSCYQNEGLRAVGIEPAHNLSVSANEKGLRTINRFFDVEAVEQVLAEFGKAHVISGNNVFAHIDRIQDVCKNMRKLLADDGIIVLEFPYLITMLKEMFFDMIYHEHLSYISVMALTHLLTRYDFKIFHIDSVSSHGGSLRVFIQRRNGPYPVSSSVSEYLEIEKREGWLDSNAYLSFAKKVYKVRENILEWVGQSKKLGKTIAGYGAPAKANTIICFCGLTRDQIQFIVDDNPLKQGTLTPGARIPVVPSDYLRDHPTDFVIIFAWNFATEILKKLDPLKSKGIRFVIPLPQLRLV